tara:strand:- start:360 stop:572 length:213 start_codon:yes stop_codon:yes gene_type:complete
MNKKELKDLIDLEVSKMFSDMVYKEPKEESREEPEKKEGNNNISKPKKKGLTEEELDEIWFYGGKKEKQN